jgi:hypothetical protein
LLYRRRWGLLARRTSSVGIDTGAEIFIGRPNMAANPLFPRTAGSVEPERRTFVRPSRRAAMGE